MRRSVFLDACPLGLVTNPTGKPVSMQCVFWLKSLLTSGTEVVVPEIADYEVRRELIRAHKVRGLHRLDALRSEPGIRYVPITSATMRRAAELWAQARQQGRPLADPKALDCDVILAAQATLADEGDGQILVATTNIGHLGLFTVAVEWQSIPIT
jgi:predicted nucleic acid-binding protein